MSTPQPRPQTAQGLRRSLNDKLQTTARTRGASVAHVRKQYVFTLLFKRLFRETDAGWAVVGGNALLLRIGGGRFTDDVDLTHSREWDDPEQLRVELNALAAHDVGDGFTFVFKRVDDRNRPDVYGYGTTSARVTAEALLGGKVFESFTLDIAVKRHLQDPVDLVPIRAIIEHPSLELLPLAPVVPIESHLADKVCALYETHHGGKPSTRYRDLADIVRIAQALPIDAARLARALEHEAGRRRLTLPHELVAPHPQWQREYPAAARGFSEFPAEYRTLDGSLLLAGQCLNPVLSTARSNGAWQPQTLTWVDL